MANLTSKELTALEEQLKAESVLVAKYKAMANDTQDAQLSSKLNENVSLIVCILSKIDCAQSDNKIS